MTTYITAACPSTDCEHQFIDATEKEVLEHVHENHVEELGDYEIEGGVISDAKMHDWAMDEEQVEFFYSKFGGLGEDDS